MSKYITLEGLGHFLTQLKENKKFEATSTSFGGIRTGYNTNGNNYAVQLDNSGNAYVNVPWIDNMVTSVDNHYQQTVKPTQTTEGLYKIKIDDAGHITLATAVTKSDITDLGIAPWVTVDVSYNTLKSMVDNSQLEPGVKYCITDYVTTTKDTCEGMDGNNLALYSQQLGFNIVVKAISNNKLSHDAHACSRNDESDVLAANFSAWELKYDIDPSNYNWAFGTSKGVIYYMKDEFGNEAPYDFKNIRVDGKYLFSTIDGGNYAESSGKLESNQPWFANNIIKPCRLGDSIRLNNICIMGSSYLNEFDENCYNIHIERPGSMEKIWNKFGFNCHDIHLTGTDNIFGNNCIKIGSGSTTSGYNNFYGNNNTFADNCEQIYSVSDIGYTMSSSGNHYVEYNTIGNNCQNILIGASSTYNTIGNYCRNVTLGCNWKGNTIKDNANGVSIQFNYEFSDEKRNLYNVTSCIFGPNCCNIYLSAFYSSNSTFNGCFDSDLKNTNKTLQNFEFLDFLYIPLEPLDPESILSYEPRQIDWFYDNADIFGRNYLSIVTNNQSGSNIVVKRYNQMI